MKCLLTSLFFSIAVIISAQSPEGVWITYDDDTGEATGHVKIFKEGEEFFGKVIKLILEPEVPVCTKCSESDDRKGEPILGMEIMRNFAKDGEKWFGRILDPENGKVYKASLALENNNTIRLRGYVGIQLFGRTQVWKRLKKQDK
jgi:uncharacterized protein (DUF2147 family)